MENKMLDMLIDLRENHHAIGVKAEFAEGDSLDELFRLKKMAMLSELDLTIKIGGCESLKDMNDVKMISAGAVVAPMIESPYALQKFIETAKISFTEYERRNIDFFINIETICGFNNLDEILESQHAKEISGIVFGRSDMCGSLGINSGEINNEIVLKYAQKISEKVLKHNKKMIIGGGVSALSLPFLKQLPKGALNYFETRKIVFDAKAALSSSNIDVGIAKAIEFELGWLKNRGDLRGDSLRRIRALKSRHSESLQNV